MDSNFDIYSSDALPRKRRRFCRCAQCGFAIYDPDEAYTVKNTGEIIHGYCLEEFFNEHMFDYVEKIDEDDI